MKHVLHGARVRLRRHALKVAGKYCCESDSLAASFCSCGAGTDAILERHLRDRSSPLIVCENVQQKTPRSQAQRGFCAKRVGILTPVWSPRQEYKLLKNQTFMLYLGELWGNLTPFVRNRTRNPPSGAELRSYTPSPAAPLPPRRPFPPTDASRFLPARGQFLRPPSVPIACSFTRGRCDAGCRPPPRYRLPR